MAGRPRLVLFVEGQGDRDAAPVLVKQLLTERNAWAHLALDPNPPFVVGEVGGLLSKDGEEWKRLLGAAAWKPALGAVLLLLDGDAGRVGQEEFCAGRFAARLASLAGEVGAGTVFSVAVVFACKEFESWLLSCADRLAGLPLPDGRPGLRAGTLAPPDVERGPRDAKGWMADHCVEGYRPTRDQKLFVELMVRHLDALRERGVRSFLRLENAVTQLVGALASRQHVATPAETAPG
jgi:hypothetical protein